MQGLGTVITGSDHPNPSEHARGLPQISSMKKIREHDGVLQKNSKGSASNSLKGGMLANNIQPAPL